MLPSDVLWDVSANQETPIEEVSWQVVFDGEGVRADDVASLEPTIRDAEHSLTQSLPGLRIDISPAAKHGKL